MFSLKDMTVNAVHVNADGLFAECDYVISMAFTKYPNHHHLLGLYISTNEGISQTLVI